MYCRPHALCISIQTNLCVSHAWFEEKRRKSFRMLLKAFSIVLCATKDNVGCMLNGFISLHFLFSSKNCPGILSLDVFFSIFCIPIPPALLYSVFLSVMPFLWEVSILVRIDGKDGIWIRDLLLFVSFFLHDWGKKRDDFMPLNVKQSWYLWP